jgi:ankyrin repeat protein
MLSWPNSPLLVMLQLVDANVLSRDVDVPLKEGETRETLLHHLAYLADPFDYSTHENQLIPVKQLIEHGAKVNAVSIPTDMTPLHNACSLRIVTYLDFVELLLKKDADPNSQDRLGRTPLMFTMQSATGAANVLLNWPTTDVNITMQSGESFPASVRRIITDISSLIARPDNPNRVKHQFFLLQWCEIEDMLVIRETTDTGITALE